MYIPRRTIEPPAPSWSVVTIVFAIGLVAVLSFALGFVALMSAWMRSVPAEFPWCGGNRPPNGWLLEFMGHCVRGVDPATITPFALSSAANASWIVNGTTGVLRGVQSTGLTANTITSTAIVLNTPVPTTVAGLDWVLSAATNAWRGVEALGNLAVSYGTDTIQVAPLAWTAGTVGIFATTNVNTAFGQDLFVRTWTLNGYQYAECRGGVNLEITNTDTLTILELDLNGITMPPGSSGWRGSGAISCVYKEMSIGSTAVSIWASTFFAKDTGYPYLVMYPPTAVGSGAPMDCTFEMGYIAAV